jgi:TorA maturation chaperone TorD
MQEAHDQVKAVYAEAGVELGGPNILADHVGAELNFLAILLERAEVGSTDGYACRQRFEQFCDRHLRSWIPRFTTDLEEATDTALYRALARATRNVVQRYGAESGHGEAGSQ